MKGLRWTTDNVEESQSKVETIKSNDFIYPCSEEKKKRDVILPLRAGSTSSWGHPGVRYGVLQTVNVLLQSSFHLSLVLLRGHSKPFYLLKININIYWVPATCQSCSKGFYTVFFHPNRSAMSYPQFWKFFGKKKITLNFKIFLHRFASKYLVRKFGIMQNYIKCFYSTLTVAVLHVLLQKYCFYIIGFYLRLEVILSILYINILCIHLCVELCVHVYVCA